MAAPGGTVVSMGVPPVPRLAIRGGSYAPPLASISRRSVRNPGWVMETECRPGDAWSVHGVLHSLSARPSSAAVAPGGLLATATEVGRAGVRTTATRFGGGA